MNKETEEKTPYDRLTDVQKAFYDGYDKGYEVGLNKKQNKDEEKKS